MKSVLWAEASPEQTSEVPRSSEGDSGATSPFWRLTLDEKQVCCVLSPGGDKRAKEEKAAATMLSRLDQARSSSSAGPGRELKEERGGQAESASRGEL